MSYSFENQCHLCVLQDKCVDKYFVDGAISGIHSVNGWSCKDNACINRGHLGAGVIKLECQNFVAIEPKPKE